MDKESQDKTVEALRKTLAVKGKQVEALQKQLDEAATAQEALSQLTGDFEAYKLDRKEAVAALTKTHAIKLALTETGTLDRDLLYSLLSLDELVLDEDGRLTGLNEQVDNIKAGKPFLFETEKDKRTPTPQITISGAAATADKKPDLFRSALNKFLG